MMTIDSFGNWEPKRGELVPLHLIAPRGFGKSWLTHNLHQRWLENQKAFREAGQAAIRAACQQYITQLQG